MDSIEKLTEISSDPISSCDPCADLPYLREKPWLEQYAELLGTKNGFFAFESALLVLPTDAVGEVPGVDDWNNRNGWIRHYREVREGTLFFAMDVFCGQFGISPSGIVRFDPETGEVSLHSDTVDSWATKLINNYDYETGWSVAKAWQAENGALPPGFRLLPKQPFVLGGDFEASNMSSRRLRDALEKYGVLCSHIKDLPDGVATIVPGWNS